MAYSNTGWKRSLKVVIHNETDGSQQGFNGMGAFSWGGHSYNTISGATLSLMPEAEYNTRLADFKSWVESQAPGLVFSEQTQPGAEAVIQDASSCPIGEIS
jgi:hypothetical protein